MGNKQLHRAKKEKNDEWYTPYNTIETEVEHYIPQLKDKIIYCNCDDYRWSNFVKYFKDNFNRLNIKELRATNYNIGDGAYYYKYDGETETITQLQCDGSFDSYECVNILNTSDIIITNPPFSLFRIFVALLEKYEKKYIIIGNGNAVTYKEIFPLIKENKMWLGNKCFSGGMDFIAGDTYDNSKCKHPKYNDNGDTIINVMMCVWFTNVPHTKQNQPLDLFKKYSKDYYPQYDNYDAIEVSKTSEIPMDYDGVMGVPITFLDKYCPEQFEIVDINPHFFTIVSQGLPKPKQLSLKSYNMKNPYARILIRHKK